MPPPSRSTTTEPITGRAGPRSGIRTDLLIAVGILFLVGPIIQEWSAQPAIRYLATVAAVDHGTLELDRYEHLLGVDRAEARGHVYSDKAPYQPMLATGPYAVYRLFGGEPFPVDRAEVDVDAVLDRTHRGLWWVTLWSSTIPAIALAVLVRRTVARVRPEVATPVAVAMAAGTLFVPFSAWLFGHVLAALAVLLAWSLVRDGPTARAAAAAGACLGLAIGVDFAVALVALVILIAVITTRRVAHVLALSAGTVAAALPLLLYNHLAFGAPFEGSYQGGNKPGFKAEDSFGIDVIGTPQLDEIVRALFGGRGMLVLTPIVVLALVGAIIILTGAPTLRRDAWVGLTAFTLLVLMTSGVVAIGRDGSPGPRYVLPALPLLAIPLAEAWRRWPIAGAAATAIGTLSMAAATLTDPVAPGMGFWRRDFVDGDFVTNVLTGDSNRWIVLVTTSLGIAVLAWTAVTATRRQADVDPPDPVPATA